MRPLRLWAFASVLALAAAACGDDSTDAPATTSPVGSDVEALAGTSWVAQQITNDSGARAVLGGSEPILEFGVDGRTVSGSTGCNSYSGDVTIGQGTIAVGQVAVTERACVAQGVMDQEARFLAVLTGADGFTLADGILVLTSAGGSVSFVEPAPVIDVALDGTAWALDTLIDGEVAMSVLQTTAPSVIVDTREGLLRGTTGCNSFGGAVVIDGGGFTVTGLTWTEIGCEPDVMRQEALILDVLQNAESFEIDGDRLTISSSAGRSLTYRAG